MPCPFHRCALVMCSQASLSQCPNQLGQCQRHLPARVPATAAIRPLQCTPKHQAQSAQREAAAKRMSIRCVALSLTLSLLSTFSQAMTSFMRFQDALREFGRIPLLARKRVHLSQHPQQFLAEH